MIPMDLNDAVKSFVRSRAAQSVKSAANGQGISVLQMFIGFLVVLAGLDFVLTIVYLIFTVGL